MSKILTNNYKLLCQRGRKISSIQTQGLINVNNNNCTEVNFEQDGFATISGVSKCSFTSKLGSLSHINS